MVSVKQIEEGCEILKPNEDSKDQIVDLKDVKTHVYCLGGNVDFDFESQSLLESVLLAQWEEKSWNSQFEYDVTACEIKVVYGKNNFIIQLNENRNINFLKEFESKFLILFGSIKPSYSKDEILLCISQGEKREKPELVSSTLVPPSGILVISNASPIEYGHVFLLPYNIHEASSYFWDKNTFESITKMALEVNSDSFRIAYDFNASTAPNHLYFQAMYFGSKLPVEQFPVSNLHNNLFNTNISIHEIIGYPIKALLLESQHIEPLVNIISEICLTLQKVNSPFSLLISDSRSKVFLFPQVQNMIDGYMSAWECAGHFVYDTKYEFEFASEEEISQKMAMVSLNERDFEALKQLCFNTIISHSL